MILCSSDLTMRSRGADMWSIILWTTVTIVCLMRHGRVDCIDPQVNFSENLPGGACRDVVIEYDVHLIRSIENCTVIDGFLHMMQINGLTHDVMDKYRLPKLREITGNLVMYHLSGLRSLRHLFPNLAVIRGWSLFSNRGISVGIVDMPDLEELGLVSLTAIENGAIMVKENPSLCYVHTIDWGKMAPSLDATKILITENKPTDTCSDNCTASCPVTDYDGILRSRCWSGEASGCQRNLACSCMEDQMCAPDGTCCDPQCIGGCSGSSAASCFACKNVIHKNECKARCPPGTYLFKEEHRCLTVSECLNLSPQLTAEEGLETLIHPKLLNGLGDHPSQCVYRCPEGFREDQTNGDGIVRCVLCKGFCEKACGSIEIHTNVSEFKKLENCTVIEGSLHITLIDFVSQEEYDQYRFPHLREITGHFMMFRVFGLRTLRNMFPNLAVIRGHDLFYRYALIALELRDLEELGLISLTTIMNGAVRLSKNYKLCYVSTIDWGRIATGVDESAHQFQDNREELMCPNYCSPSCTATKYNGPKEIKRCWTSKPDGCQKNLDCKCGGRPCLPNGTCCHQYCVGGCSGTSQSDCFACKNVIYKNSCEPKCPYATYMLANRRCLIDKDCLSLMPRPGPDDEDSSPVRPKLLEGSGGQAGQCLFRCPKGYTPGPDKGDGPTHCVECEGFCPKVCYSTKIFSVEDSLALRGCSKVEGYLVIQIKGGENIDKKLTENLGNIREVTQYIMVMRSGPLLTLHFFKSLEIIEGKKLAYSLYSLFVIDNINLQELFPESQMKKMVVRQGRVSFHGNRKLCFNKIEHFVQVTKIGPDRKEKGLYVDINNITNGDQTPCKQITLNLTIYGMRDGIVYFTFTPYSTGSVNVGNTSIKTGDIRQVLRYEAYFREAKENITNIFQGRDACSEDDWHQKKVGSHDGIFFLRNLKPFSRYAIYLEAVTLSRASRSAMSPMIYFMTKPSKPTKPVDLEVTSSDPYKLDIRWKPPSSPNGNVTHYKVYYTLQKMDYTSYALRDYCSDDQKDDMEKLKRIEAEEKAKEEPLANQTCCECPKKVDLETEKQARERENDFEDFLLNHVYTKSANKVCNTPVRTTKQANDTQEEYDGDPSKIRVRRSLNMTGTASLSPNMTPEPVADPGSLNLNMTSEPMADSLSSASPTPGMEAQEPITKEVIVYGTKVTLGDLQHYSLYNIEVVACHEIDPKTGVKLCGDKKTSAMTTGQTKRYGPFDMIDVSTIRVVQTPTKTQEIFIQWQPPERTNGLILKYEFRYWMTSPKPQAIPVGRCVSRQHFSNNSGGYRLSALEPGNYTFQIRVVTLAGNGTYTPGLHFSVPALPGGKSDDTQTIVIIIICVVLLATAALLSAYCYYKSKQRKRADIVSSNPHYLHTDDFYAPDEWEVDRDDIRLIKELGQGSFGMVFEGVMENKEEASSTRVAIKTVNDKADFMERCKILKEASTMKVFECHHVVKLLGVVSKGQPALVILELMALGDLRNYLRRCRIEEEEFPDFTPPSSNKIRQMAGEIADGMAYLADKKIVHRDLAARNCLVAEDTTVKIADFGMARDVYLTEYYRKDQRALLPIRWMAPESLLDGVFTTMSDIWSYGVVLWEMVTLAEQPYQGLGNEQVLKFVTEGQIMNEPEGCPEDLFDMMKICWAFNPRNRPTFKNLIEMLVPFLSNHFHEVSYFFQEVVHSDGNDNTVEYISEGIQNNEHEDDDNDDDETGDPDEEEDDRDSMASDQARFEEEKLIKGSYNLYASNSGDEEDAILGFPVTNLSTPTSSRARPKTSASSKPISVSPRDHSNSPKAFKGNYSSPMVLEQGGLQQPLLYPSPHSSTKDHSYRTNSHERLPFNNLDNGEHGVVDANSEDALDSLHIDEDEPASERLKLLPKLDGPHSQIDYPGCKPAPRSSKALDLKSDQDNQYTVMFSPVSKNVPNRQGGVRTLSPFSPTSNPTSLCSPPIAPSPSSSILPSPHPATSPSSPLSLSSPSTDAAATSSISPPFSLAPLTVSPVMEAVPQSKSKPTLQVTTEGLYAPNRDSYSGRSADNKHDSRSGLKWHDVLQNNTMMANNGEGGNSASRHMHSDTSDIDSVTSGGRSTSEGSGSKESSSSIGSHHALTGGTANGHGPYSRQQATFC